MIKNFGEKINFLIFIYGQSINSIRVQENVKKFCETHLQASYEIKVIDLAKEPERAVEYHILAVPTTIIEYKGTQKKLIGTLQDIRKLSEILMLETG